MLITLYARAMENRSADPILSDPWSDEVVGRIDYDFERLKVGKLRAGLIALRARQLDLWTSQFIATHPEATVLHLGCGLDSRVFRVDPPSGVRWIDLDYPEVIDMRRRLYAERPGCRMIGAALQDLDWLEGVPADAPSMVVAEGVTMYLTRDIMKRLLNRVVGHFPDGQFAFDIVSGQLVRALAKSVTTVRETGASFGWGIDAPGDVESLEPALELIEDRRVPRMAGFGQLPWADRTVARAMDAVPRLRRMQSLLFRF